MKIICTICSKDKDRSKTPLPAVNRYISDRIISIHNLAIQQNLPFYILSGKYGLIQSSTKIAYYDQRLTDDLVERITILVCEQIQQNNINHITFYVKDKLTWKPYLKVLEKACEATDAELETIYLD